MEVAECPHMMGPTLCGNFFDTDVTSPPCWEMACALSPQ